VEAVQAQFGALPLEERMSGTVRALNQVAIYPEVSGPVESVAVQTGDYVEAGDPLVRLDDDAYQDRVRQAEAALRIAQADAKSAAADLDEAQARLRRTEQLAEQQFESEQQLETLRAQVQRAEANAERAQAQVEQARATLNERQTDLRRTVVRAPISGYVGQRNAEVGQRADTGTRLYTMGNLDTVKVLVQVTDKMFGRVRPGQTARIHAEDTVLTASVTRMSPFLSDESYSAEAEIEVDNNEQLLNPGMFVEVDVAYGESQQATIVPMSALYENPDTGERGIFVAPTLGTEVPIETPESYDPQNPPPLSQPTPTEFRSVEILAEGQQTAGVRGVEPGTWVVTVGQNLLSTTDERIDARVRPMPWSRLIALQRLQDTDLLYRFLDRQREIAQRRFGDQDSTQTDSVQSSGRQSAADASPQNESSSQRAGTTRTVSIGAR
jgi:RND family efflux transporter MFP subunit